MAPWDGSAATWKASTALSRANRWVTKGLRSMSPPATSRMALGYSGGRNEGMRGQWMDSGRGWKWRKELTVAVSVLVLQVDLVGGQVHEGVLEEGEAELVRCQ